MNNKTFVRFTLAAMAASGALLCAAAPASSLPLFPFLAPPQIQEPASPAPEATLPPTEDATAVPSRFKRQVVDYRTAEAPGTIIIDTPNTFLYFVLGNGKAMRYGIGIGREGFTWSGVQSVTRKAEWPDWTPPAEMVARQPYLPRFMAGGPQNPLGARAMYLGGTIYRIHGTNQPQTIGGRVSSGCIRMTNDDVIDLYGRVSVGTKVIVRPISERHAAGTDGGRG